MPLASTERWGSLSHRGLWSRSSLEKDGLEAGKTVCGTSILTMHSDSSELLSQEASSIFVSLELGHYSPTPRGLQLLWCTVCLYEMHTHVLTAIHLRIWETALSLQGIYHCGLPAETNAFHMWEWKMLLKDHMSQKEQTAGPDTGVQRGLLHAQNCWAALSTAIRLLTNDLPSREVS